MWIFHAPKFSLKINSFFPGSIEVSVNILPESGNFVVLSNETIVVRGKIRTHELSNLVPNTIPAVEKDAELSLESSDIYSEFENRCVSVHEKSKNIRNLQIYSRGWFCMHFESYVFKSTFS